MNRASRRSETFDSRFCRVSERSGKFHSSPSYYIIYNPDQTAVPPHHTPHRERSRRRRSLVSLSVSATRRRHSRPVTGRPAVLGRQLNPQRNELVKKTCQRPHILDASCGEHSAENRTRAAVYKEECT